MEACNKSNNPAIRTLLKTQRSMVSQAHQVKSHSPGECPGGQLRVDDITAEIIYYASGSDRD